MDEKRCYNLVEAAQELNYAPTTLRDRVTAGSVPHHRRHRIKGVFFTRADLDEILATAAVEVGSRRPNHAPVGNSGVARASSNADVLARFAHLTSARTQPH